MQEWADTLTNPANARAWRLVAALLRHRFRYDIEIAEAAEQVFGEFDIEIEES